MTMAVGPCCVANGEPLIIVKEPILKSAWYPHTPRDALAATYIVLVLLTVFVELDPQPTMLLRAIAIRITANQPTVLTKSFSQQHSAFIHSAFSPQRRQSAQYGDQVHCMRNRLCIRNTE